MTNIAKFVELQELDIQGIPLPIGIFKKLIDTFKVLRTLKITFLNSSSISELVSALDPKRRGNPESLLLLCLCHEDHVS